MNCREPTATPSVMLPSVTADVWPSSARRRFSTRVALHPYRSRVDDFRGLSSARAVTGFQLGSRVPVTQNSSSRAEAGAVTVRLSARTLSFSKNRCPPPQVIAAAEVSLEFLRQEERCVTRCRTRSAAMTPAIPTGSMARVLVSSVSSLPKRQVMAFSSWTLLRAQAPSSCEHPFPCFESTLSNLEA